MDITLTQKERILLEDQKSHEQTCIGKYASCANQVSDEQLKQIFKANEQAERNHLDTVNQLLGGTIPNINQQGNQSSNQGMNTQQNNQSTQQDNQGSNNNAQTASGLTEKDICADLLSTEKYVSGTYNTAIFEFKDTRVRDILNHIQKEEQQHGEAIFQYMNNNGMYAAQ
ncbi:MAG: spore coat protein [Bacillota bacterium]|nr:spore coat protein [Bacillota bacterium]